MSDLAERAAALEAAVNDAVVERRTITHCLITALLSRSHVCIEGIPGVAKSFLVRTLVAGIEGMGGYGTDDYFEASLGRFAPPEVLLGPYGYRALQQDEFVRNTARRLPRARIGVITDIHEANAAVLGDLLPMLNERLFFNGPDDPHIPLSTFVCDTNFSMEDSAPLAALWDRLHFHLRVDPIADHDNYVAMLAEANTRLEGAGDTTRPVVRPVISWPEILQAQHEVTQVGVGAEIFAALADLRFALAAEGIHPSDRRGVDCLRIVKAEAWRAGRSAVALEDLAVLSHVLLPRQDQAPVVQRLVFRVANPIDTAALDLAEEAADLDVRITALAAEESLAARQAEGLRIHHQLMAPDDQSPHGLADKVALLLETAETTGRRSELLEPLRQRIVEMAQRVYALMAPPS